MFRVLGGKLLLQHRRCRLVMRQRHRPRALAARHRLEPRRVALELGQRCKAADREHARRERVGAGDLSTARRQVAGDVAHHARRAVDLDAHDGLTVGIAWAGNPSLRAGAVVISVNYRHAPEDRFPAAADDAFAAVQWIAANAAGLGGIPSG